jgi:hypothetical protein
MPTIAFPFGPTEKEKSLEKSRSSYVLSFVDTFTNVTMGPSITNLHLRVKTPVALHPDLPSQILTLE